MPELLTPALCVIGATAGGLAIAAAAASLGVATVVVEHGGSGEQRLRRGNIAVQALIAASRRAHRVRTAANLGITAQPPAIEFDKVYGHVRAVLRAAAPNDTRARFAGLGVHMIEGDARFANASTVVAGEHAIKAGKFVIATGASPSPPAGLDATAYLTGDDFLDMTEPRHLVILGAGRDGLELAQAYLRLGSAVTVLDSEPPLADDDAECVRIVLDRLVGEGLKIRTGVTVLGSIRAGPNVAVSLLRETAEDTVEGSHLIVAGRRKASIDTLDLAAAGIKTTADGIAVNKRMVTSNGRVLAIGGAVGAAFDRVENHHAEIVIQNVLLKQSAERNDDAVPRVMFTEPELAQIGLTEAQAGERGQRLHVFRAAYRDNDRALVERDPAGHIKIVTSKSGTILGVTMVGRNAGDLMAPWTLAMRQGLGIDAIADLPVAPFTMTEIGKRAAVAGMAASLTSSLVRRIMGPRRR